jgi:hypothetical protein
MLKFRLKRATEDECEYVYLVEGKADDSGTVIWDRRANEARVGNMAAGDEFTIYARHLMKRLRDEFMDSGVLPESGMVAWY